MRLIGNPLKRSVPFFFWLSALAAGAARAHAADVLVFGSIEQWSVGGAFDGVAREFANSWIPPAGAVVAGEVSTGLGFRLGALAGTPLRGFSAGGSLGYIAGPEGKFHTFAQSPTSTWDVRDDYETRFIRILPQARQELPLAGTFSLRLDAGVGLALGKIESDHGCVAGGAGLCGSPADSASASFSGLTYEFGPSLVYKGPGLSLQLGLLYAGFPSRKASLENGVSYIPAFKWRPVGVVIGVGF